MSARVTSLRVAAGAVALSGLLTGCAGMNTADDSTGGNRFISGDGDVKRIPVNERKAPQNASGTTLDGKPLTLASLRGKVTVVNFWASWCAPCRGEAPSLEQLSTETGPKGAKFVGVNFKDSQGNARAFERRFKITYPSLYDGSGQIGLAFRDVPPNAIPSTLILDRQGRVAVRILGATTYSTLSPLVTDLLAEK